MKKSAGLLLYRFVHNRAEVFLVHPGGPFWAKKDAESWSIPKGEFTDDEDPLTAAKREFLEETSIPAEGTFWPLAPVRQKSGKQVYAWALEQDLDPEGIQSNTFEMEWPPKSGRRQTFPEVDRAAWYTLPQAREKINTGQIPLLDELEKQLKQQPGG